MLSSDTFRMKGVGVCSTPLGTCANTRVDIMLLAVDVWCFCTSDIPCLVYAEHMVGVNGSGDANRL